MLIRFLFQTKYGGGFFKRLNYIMPFFLFSLNYWSLHAFATLCHTSLSNSSIITLLNKKKVAHFYRFGTSIAVCAYFPQIEAAEKWAWSAGLVATGSALLNDGNVTLRFPKAHCQWSLYTVEILQCTLEAHCTALRCTLCSITWLNYSLSEDVSNKKSYTFRNFVFLLHRYHCFVRAE